jgi:dUTP pyrophosphatase
MVLKYYKVKEYAHDPVFATDGSACFDVKACFKLQDRIRSFNPWNKEVEIAPKMVAGELSFQLVPENRALVPTGLIFDVPTNHVLKMYIRSSAALKKGLILANGVGIIDSDFVDETHIILYNKSDSLVVIKNGERLAQCALEETLKYTLKATDTKPGQKTNRDGGFGSTGE